MSLRKKTVSSVKWASFAQFGRQGMSYITTAILAHLLAPSDYGLIGMAIVVIGFIELFKDLGTSAAIVQKKNVNNELLSSIFWANTLFCFGVLLIIYIVSPFISKFYKEPRLTEILRFLSLSFLFSGLSVTQNALLQKNLSFNFLAKVDLFAFTTGCFAGIYLAFKGAGVWSLVSQTLITSCVTALLLWRVSKWRPNFFFSWSQIKEVSSYSLYLTGYNIFNYFSRNMDYILIGRCLGAQDLGYYTLAYQLMLYPLQSVTSVISRVLFPVFSIIQNNNKQFGEVYLKICTAISMITFPMMAGLFCVSDTLIPLVLGDKWEPVVLLLMILAPVGMGQSIGATVGTIYQSKGRTDLMLLWGIISGVLVICSFFIGLKWGVNGVAFAYSISVYLMAYPNFAIPFRLINLKFHLLLTMIYKPFLCSIIMVATLIIVKRSISDIFSNIIQLVVLVPLGIFIYGGTMLLIDKKTVFEMTTFFKNK